MCGSSSPSIFLPVGIGRDCLEVLLVLVLGLEEALEVEVFILELWLSKGPAVGGVSVVISMLGSERDDSELVAVVVVVVVVDAAVVGLVEVIVHS